MTTRREVLSKLFKGAALTSTGGLLWGSLANSAKGNQFVLRPPGAQAEDEFIRNCIKCGQCVTDCPFDTLLLAGTNDDITTGTPYFKPRKVPCYMCTDYPCIKACPTNALKEEKLKEKGEKANINNARMGLAVVHTESCIAFNGIQCDACYRACPLMGKAITLQPVKNKDTGVHANLQPVVNSIVCTGCGLCEHACVTEKAAIFVLPLEYATGKTGDHYVLMHGVGNKGMQPVEKSRDTDTESALEYLNNNDPLSE